MKSPLFKHGCHQRGKSSIKNWFPQQEGIFLEMPAVGVPDRHLAGSLIGPSAATSPSLVRNATSVASSGGRTRRRRLSWPRRRASVLTQAGPDPIEGDHAEQEEEPDRHQQV